MGDSRENELLETIAAWDRAMVGNEPDAIGRYMADEWKIIGSNGNVLDKSGFLGLVETKELSHDTMESQDLDVRFYGDVAIVLSSGISKGEFRGERFSLVERVSCTFVSSHDRWECVLTHLSEVAGDDSSDRPENDGGMVQ